MKKIETKYLIAAGIGLFTITGAIAYLQYRKFMNYEMKVSLDKIKTISSKLISFDILINFMNKSSISMKIISNTSNIFINNAFVTKISNNKPFVILPNSVSTIPINIEFKPSDIIKAAKLNLVDIAVSPEKINIRVDTDLKAKFWGLTINLAKNTSTFNLKEMMDQNKMAKNQQ